MFQYLVFPSLFLLQNFYYSIIKIDIAICYRQPTPNNLGLRHDCCCCICYRHLTQYIYCFRLEEQLIIIGCWHKLFKVGKFSKISLLFLSLFSFLYSTNILFMQVFSHQLSTFPVSSLFLCSCHPSYFLKWFCMIKV